MRCEDYLEIQMLISRFRVSVAARAFMTIPTELFAKDDGVTLSLEPQETVRGFDGICAWCDKARKAAEANGGIVSADYPVSQVIEVSEDGQTACGTWLTYSLNLSGPVRASEPSRDLTFSVGKLECTFTHANKRWRIHTMTLRPLMMAAPWPFSYERSHGIATEHPELWPQPPLRINEPAGEPESDPRSEAVLEISNLVGTFAQRLAGGHRRLAALRFFAEDAYWENFEYDVQVDGLSAIKPYYEKEENEGPFGIDLTTAPVVYANRAGTEGRGMWNTFSIRYAGDKLQPIVGRWYAEFEKRPAGWRCTAFKSVDICDLAPWAPAAEA